MTNHPIPAEAVEAAANLIVQGDRGACECRQSIFDKHDVNPPCSTYRQALRVARAALEAAAPYLQRDAWDEGWQKAHSSDDPAMAGIFLNPYRLNNEGEK